MRSALREDTQPWYKEPWPWLLMAGPAIVIVACIFTIYLAFSRFDQPLTGGAEKRGLQVVPTQKTEQIKPAHTTGKTESDSIKKDQ